MTELFKLLVWLDWDVFTGWLVLKLSISPFLLLIRIYTRCKSLRMIGAEASSFLVIILPLILNEINLRLLCQSRLVRSSLLESISSMSVTTDSGQVDSRKVSDQCYCTKLIVSIGLVCVTLLNQLDRFDLEIFRQSLVLDRLKILNRLKLCLLKATLGSERVYQESLNSAIEGRWVDLGENEILFQNQIQFDWYRTANWIARCKKHYEAKISRKKKEHQLRHSRVPSFRLWYW